MYEKSRLHNSLYLQTAEIGRGGGSPYICMIYIFQIIYLDTLFIYLFAAKKKKTKQKIKQVFFFFPHSFSQYLTYLLPCKKDQRKKHINIYLSPLRGLSFQILIYTPLYSFFCFLLPRLTIYPSSSRCTYGL